MVLMIAAEVISQPAYSFREQRHLYFGGAGVTRLGLVLSDYSLFCGSV